MLTSTDLRQPTNAQAVQLGHDPTLIEERLQDIAILMRICYGEDSQAVIRADETCAALQRLKWALERTNVRALTAGAARGDAAGRYRATFRLWVPVYPCLRFVTACNEGIDYFSNPAHHLTGPGCRRTAYPPKWQTVEPWGGNWGRYLNACDFVLPLRPPPYGFNSKS